MTPTQDAEEANMLRDFANMRWVCAACGAVVHELDVIKAYPFRVVVPHADTCPHWRPVRIELVKA